MNPFQAGNNQDKWEQKIPELEGKYLEYKEWNGFYLMDKMFHELEFTEEGGYFFFL